MKDVMSQEVFDALAALRCGTHKMVYARHELDRGRIYCTLEYVRPPATEAQIREAVLEVIAANPDKVKQVQEKPARLGWFVGKTMQALHGAADPERVCFVCHELLFVPA